jgi:hypothetical protein
VHRLAREIGDPYEEAKILEGIAESTLSARRPDAARILFRQALDIFERLGVPEAESARIRIETIDPLFGRLPRSSLRRFRQPAATPLAALIYARSWAADLRCKVGVKLGAMRPPHALSCRSLAAETPPASDRRARLMRDTVQLRRRWQAP